MADIKQPSGYFDGSLRLEWDGGFAAKYSERFHRAQQYVDRECIQLMIPYTPMRTGILSLMNPQTHTVLGSGRIEYDGPYARYLYYGIVWGPNIPRYENGILMGFWSPKKKHPTGRKLQYDKSTHPLAGAYWFERMKADHKEEIARGASRIAGGRIR